MTSDRYVLAVDLGTTGLKVGIVSTTGEIMWTADAELTTVHLPHGGAEQDADEWWRLISDATRAALRSGVIDPGKLVAVSTTGEWASTVPVDDQGVPVGPCILWMDTRGGRHVRRRIGGKVSGYKAKAIANWIRRTGGAPATSGADPIGHMLHLATDRPDIARAARWYLEPVDYLGMRFTGEAIATHASMTGAWLTDNRNLSTLAYDRKLIELSGVDASKLAPLRPTASIIGTVRDDLADELDLPHGVQVVAGTPDLHSASVGAGTVLDFQTHMAISTTSWISCPVPFKKTDIPTQIASVPGAGPDGYLVANNHETAGACLQWLRDMVVAPDDALSTGARPDFDALCALAESVPAGANGVLFTPWLTGERSPVDDKTARAGFHNVGIEANRAVLVRAVLEGVAFNARWLHDAVEKFAKRRLEPIRVFGGGARSDLWCQIHADVMDRSVERLADPMHTGLRGAALLAGIALGDVERASVRDHAPIDATFTPDASTHGEYDRLYAEFTKLYKAQKDMFHRLNRPQNKGTSRDS
ncbi:MAG TPA: FGGY-family carbohydrate kinase [Acidimicrobiales bacterium]|jgi:xylulokinase|nr:FGGY-family carbohydrate kinase [Acidimicrobiales bacterium]